MSAPAASYRPDIDGLRALAVGVVVIYHAFPDALPGGFVGVDVFFVISGFLISRIILDALAEGRFSFAHFYARRIRRIFPALLLVLAAVSAVGWVVLYADDYQRLGRHVAAGAGFVSNFVLWQESSYFDVAADLKPLLHLWSLGIEEQFYLVWPLVLVLASRWRLGPMDQGRVGRGALAVTVAIAAISFLLAIWTVRIDRTPAFFAPWNRFWELLAGAMLACLQADRAWNSRLDALLTARWAPGALAFIGLAAIAAGVWLIDSTRVFPGLWVLLPVGGTVLLIASGGQSWISRWLLSNRLAVGVGLISYPLYLWHWPLLSFTRIIELQTPEPAVRWFLIAVSVVLSWLTYIAFERPVRFTWRGGAVVSALAAAMVLVGAFGLATVRFEGFIDRGINRSDAASLVAYYERVRRNGIAAAYRAECDFMDWRTEAAREQLDPSCTAPGEAATYLLWGDSFAQSLSSGIREQLPRGARLAQVTTSNCRPATSAYDNAVPGRRCERANEYAMDAIRRLRPALVIVAQSSGHAATDWPALAAAVRERGAAAVLLVGPFPLWQPSLPSVYGRYHLADRAEYIRTGLDPGIFAADRSLAAAVAGVPGLTYLSLLDHLCRDGACLGRVPGDGALDLMSLDFGHLTPAGSSFVGRVAFRRYVNPTP